MTQTPTPHERLHQLQLVLASGLGQLAPQDYLRLSESPLPEELSAAQAFRLRVLRVILLRQALQTDQGLQEVAALEQDQSHGLPEDVFMLHGEACRLALADNDAKSAVRHYIAAQYLAPDVPAELQGYQYMVAAVIYSYLQEDELQLQFTRMALQTPIQPHFYHICWNQHNLLSNLGWVLAMMGRYRLALRLIGRALRGLAQDYPHSLTIRTIQTESLVYRAALGQLQPDDPDLLARRAELSGLPNHAIQITLGLATALAAQHQGDWAAADAAYGRIVELGAALRDGYGRIGSLAHGYALEFYRQHGTPEQVILLLETRIKILEQQRKRTANILQYLGDQTSALIGVRQELELSRAELVNRLSAIGEHRDDETGHHTRRVAHLTYWLAQKLGLPDAADIGTASRLHDLGKVSLPDSILMKPGPLSAAERLEMQRHTTSGAQMLAGASSTILQLAQQIAQYHHERWDGQGYPEQLSGQAIPLPARIVAVADVYDALTSERPYKRAWTRAEALAEIRSQSGKQFDPQVVDALDELMQEPDWFAAGLPETA